MVARRSVAKTQFLLKLALANTPRIAPSSALALEPVDTGDFIGEDEAVYAFDHGGMRGEVTIEAHADDWQAPLYEQAEPGDLNFADMYEPVAGLGDVAAWGANIHTLRVRQGMRRVTVSLDLPFGADAPEGALELACDAARAALEFP